MSGHKYCWDYGSNDGILTSVTLYSHACAQKWSELGNLSKKEVSSLLSQSMSYKGSISPAPMGQA